MNTQAHILEGIAACGDLAHFTEACRLTVEQSRETESQLTPEERAALPAWTRGAFCVFLDSAAKDFLESPAVVAHLGATTIHSVNEDWIAVAHEAGEPSADSELIRLVTAALAIEAAKS